MKYLYCLSIILILTSCSIFCKKNYNIGVTIYPEYDFDYDTTITCYCDEYPSFCQFLSSYGVSVTTAVAIGITCGRLCRRYDWYIPFPINWFLWSRIRTTLARCASSGLSTCAIKNNKDAIESIAWISDWLAYLYE